MKTKTQTVQDVFFQKLKEVMPPSIGMAEEIAELLNVSIDSAYRRIRGETALGINEIYTITKKYGVSLDNIFSSLGDTVTFKYTKLVDSKENFIKYLNNIQNHLKTLNNFPDRKLYYVAEELPIFYSFFNKKLTEFKLFYWQRSVLNVPEFQGQKFKTGLVDKELIELAYNCYLEYKKTPSVEIWTSETIFTVTKQIEHYAESGVFENKQDALDLIGTLREMTAYLKDCADTGRKEISDKTENFQLYHSEVVLGTNCIYINVADAKHAYISFNTMNSLNTNNNEFCEETEHWVKNIIKKSTLISGVAEKQRYQFFSKLNNYINESENKIKAV